MARRDVLRDGEVRVISVTPVSRGVLRPFLLTLTTLALIVDGSSRYALVHRYESWLTLLLVLPMLLVTLTRTWRWRSFKVRVTNQRVVLEGGVLRHWHTSIEMADVIATRVDQRVSERLTRRGMVYVETLAGPMPIGLMRHPSALARLIDAERVIDDDPYVPLDTVYTFDEPRPYELDVRPDEWQRRRFE